MKETEDTFEVEIQAKEHQHEPQAENGHDGYHGSYGHEFWQRILERASEAPAKEIRKWDPPERVCVARCRREDRPGFYPRQHPVNGDPR